MQPQEFNPYSVPEGLGLAADDLSGDPVLVRRQFIHCESNIKSIGGLMVLGGFLVSAGFGLALVSSIGNSRMWANAALGIYLMFVLGGLWQIYTGTRLLKLNRTARIPAAIACSLWILFIPVGTILGGVSLWYLLRPAAAFIFSEKYADVVLKTPHEEASTSIAGWGALIVCLTALALVVTYLTR